MPGLWRCSSCKTKAAATLLDCVKKEPTIRNCNRPAMNTVDAAIAQEKVYLLGEGSPIAD
jgi:hypothetical protein